MSLHGDINHIMNMPLSGIRVLDFSHAAAGPYATQCLADLGADVIKIERPGRGDGSRYMGEPLFGPADSDYYVGLNRNKRSALIDLHTPRGVGLAQELAEQSDIVVQNFRPGVMDRLGLGFSDLAKRRDGLIYCSISAFGSSGPWRDLPANDVIMQSVSGLMGVTGERDGGPVKVGTPVCDYTAGLFGLVGVLTALNIRADHPEGQHVEISMLDASVALMSNYIPAVLDLGKTIPRLGRAHAQLVPYQAFVCEDDQYVMVGAFTNGFWQRLCAAMGHPEWSEDPRFATNAMRMTNRDELIPLLDAEFARRPRSEWLTVLRDADVPTSPVYELHETVGSEQAIHSRTTFEVRDGDRAAHVARFPVRAEGWERESNTLAPKMGQHTEEVLRTITGVTEAELSGLIQERVVATEDGIRADA